jgi:ornithine carbamoyltransferase
MASQPRHLLKISDLTKDEIIKIIDCAVEIKKNPVGYRNRFVIDLLFLLFM